MRRPRWATGPVLVILAVVGLVIAVALVVITSHVGNNKPNGVASDSLAQIPAGGGVTLAAEVITPKGSGPFPLVVMPGSWGSAAVEYRLPGQQFAAAGYQVVGYAQRGFTGSGGAVDFAGDKTRADAETVIDWALAHTHADKNRIGMLGISYGGGISLLTAAADSRIKAVVSMSGWSNLAEALAPHKTPNIASMHLLLDRYAKAGSLAPEIHQLVAGLPGPATATASTLDSLSKSRSADTQIAALNRNRPAIMIANAYEDSIIDPAQVVPFFNQLTTPKRIQFAPGDHGGPETPGLRGKSDQTFTDAKSWLDHYLLGKANGIDRADPIQLVDGATNAVHSYRTWPKTTTSDLAAPNRSGAAIGSADTSWTKQLTAGTDSGASSGPLFTAQPVPYRPPSLTFSSVKTDHALVWAGAAVSKPTVISGTPTLRLDIGGSSPASTFFAYLYDVDGSGAATLMTYAPETTTGGEATVSLRPTSWTLRSGHHLALVIDTVDQRYRSATGAGATLRLSSTAAAPATLRLPRG
ncbi:MAG: hypothetical protein QOC66_1302 [Pseudonocardiales bacterium]|jgi:predicted acyl esterase|nr:hypothetical protein [Pseudonocardiales bacterium]